MAHKNVLVVRKAALAVATALALVSVSLTETAQAAGLGALTVQSALGQPLRAEVEVTSVTPEELQTLSARLASQQAFKQAGIEFNPALTTARFSLDKRNGRNIIRVTTTQPINEPFVDLLVELNWATGRLVREYTFLLDPPELRVGKAPEAIAPASTMPAPTPAQVSPAPASSETATAATPSTSALATTPESKPEQKTESPATSASTSTQATKTDTAAPSTEIKVKSGDSLSKIAARNLPSDVTLEQMLVALYRANPQSFAGNNMNRLKAGSILRVPEATEATAVAAPVARKEVVVQAKDFANYRSNLAGAVAKSVSAVATTAPATQAAQGQVTPKVEDKAAPKAEAKDQVKLARPQTATQPGTIAGGGAAAQADSAIAKEKALKEANQRVAELQRNISEMQKTLAQQNEAMAKAQEAAKNKASSPSPTAAPAPGKAEPPKAEPPKAEPPKAEPPKAEPPKAEPPKAEPPKAEPPKAEPPKAEPPKAEPPKAEPPKKSAAAPAPPPEKDFLSELLENPMILGGAALFLAVVGGGLVWYRRRQTKKLAQFQDSILTGDDLKSNSIFGATGGKSVDTNDSTFNSSFTPSASQIDSNEVDPIAEADVYIAYGRDTQAEEILKEALKITPDRQAIRVKLLEIYAARKDLGGFSSLAGELYQYTNGEGDDWARASELGRSLDPRNPLYAQQADLSKQAQTLTSPTALSDLAVGGSPAAIPVDFDLGAPLSPPATTITQPTVNLSSTAIVDRNSGRAQDAFGLEQRSSGLVSSTLETTQPTPALDFSLDKSSALSGMPVSGPDSEPAKVSLDFDLNLSPGSPSANSVPEIDLSNISLDLSSGKAESPADFESIAVDPAAARQQEMATKLDLAAAYQEIGDREGAKELLEEVMRGGDPQQQSRAQKLLESIA